MNNEMTTDNMSNEEAIEVLKGIVFGGFDRTTRKERQALDFAIKVLEERPQGEWIIAEVQCPNCFKYFDTDCYSADELNKCPSCGAKMQKGGAE